MLSTTRILSRAVTNSSSMITTLKHRRMAGSFLQGTPAIGISSSLPSIHRHQTFQVAAFSGYILDGIGGGGGGGRGTSADGGVPLWNWPIRKTNTIFNIVPQGHMYVVERLGKLHSIQNSGFFLAIPLVDTISYVIDIRERALDIAPQAAITRDNVSVEVAGNLFVRFLDPEKAAYGALNPLYSVTQHAQSAMRSAIGEMELDEILHGRAKLNALIKGSLQEAAEPWGLEVRRYEITEITPDQQIRIAMDKQAAAERDRREQVLRAEGAKRRAELESEGLRISLSNESEGSLIKVRNEAEATKSRMLLEAQGQAEAIRLTAQAQAEALAKISAELNKPGGTEAARLALAREYVEMYGEMGKQSNTILFNERPADVSALMAQAMTAMKVVGATSEGIAGAGEKKTLTTTAGAATGSNTTTEDERKA